MIVDLNINMIEVWYFKYVFSFLLLLVKSYVWCMDVIRLEKIILFVYLNYKLSVDCMYEFFVIIDVGSIFEVVCFLGLFWVMLSCCLVVLEVDFGMCFLIWCMMWLVLIYVGEELCKCVVRIVVDFDEVWDVVCCLDDRLCGLLWVFVIGFYFLDLFV